MTRRWRVLIVASVALVVAAYPSATAPSSVPLSYVAGITATPLPSSTTAPTLATTAVPAVAASPTETQISPPTSAQTGSTPAPQPLCSASQLRAAVSVWTTAPGVTTGRVVATNVSTTLCYMRGEAQAQMVDGVGHVLADSGAASARMTSDDPYYALGPGDRIGTTVEWGNWCPRGPSQPVTIAFVLPLDLGRFVSSTGPHTPVPTCTGSDDTTASSARWTP